MARPIPRRTAQIELWDTAPVGSPVAWQREMLQFWSLILTKGRRTRTPPYMVVLNPETGKNRPRTVRELAHILAIRIAGEAKAIPTEVTRSVEEWLVDAVIIPGERRKGLDGPPAAGLYVPHFVGLSLFARASTRERYWATTFYLWLAADQAHTDLTGDAGVASRVAAYLSDGLKLDPSNDPGQVAPFRWSVDLPVLRRKDPEVLLTTIALGSHENDGLPSFEHGLPRDYFALAKAVLDPADDKFSILCPGSVMLLRRALALLMNRAESVGHEAIGRLVETALAHHAAQYYVRGMRVLNDLVRLRRLPDDCAACWAKFADDLSPLPPAGRPDRWLAGSYDAAATASNAQFVEDTCKSPYPLFLNAGTKEDRAAKEVGRISLENLRQQLGDYTVNRLWMSIAWDVATEVAPNIEGLRKPATIAHVLSTLDLAYGNSGAVLYVADKWRSRIRFLATDKDVPPDIAELVADALDDAARTPRELEELARTLISETVLSTRYFGRYVEVLNSILGGGALPSNQDPKGIMARGGRSKLPFHLAVNDSVLELLVAVMAMEADSAGKQLSFTEFLDQVSRRYLVEMGTVPEHLSVGTGLEAEAISQSRQALRARLSAMGLLDEFSDSSSWNRVHWDR